MFVAVIGKKFVGKDTFADHLVDNYGYQKKAFAFYLKKICQVAFQLTEADLHSPTKKESIHPFWGKSPRELMQMVGTNLFRAHFDKDIWIKRMELELQHETPRSKIVFSDVRFENEFLFVRNYCYKQKIPFVAVHLSRPCLESCSMDHLSENHEWTRHYPEIQFLVNDSQNKIDFCATIDSFMYQWATTVREKEMLRETPDEYKNVNNEQQHLLVHPVSCRDKSKKYQ